LKHSLKSGLKCPDQPEYIQVDRLELNAYIERLIDSRGHDEEARGVLAEFAANLDPGSPVQMLGAIVKPGSSVSGQTPEHGTVKVEDEKEERREFEKGVVQERVGLYKLMRQKNLLVISHFWKADLGTQSETEPAPEWALALDRAGWPMWFGERAVKRLFRVPIGPLVIDVTRNVYVESWGGWPGRQHNGALMVAVSFSM
jgi:hypothetical protein